MDINTDLSAHIEPIQFDKILKNAEEFYSMNLLRFVGEDWPYRDSEFRVIERATEAI